MDIPTPTPRRPPQPRGLRCFIVEDSVVIRQNLIATLEEMLEVETVGTAEDEQGAVDWLRGSAPDACELVIIDIFLKSGTGLEVLRQARELMPDTALAVLTNRGETLH